MDDGEVTGKNQKNKRWWQLGEDERGIKPRKKTLRQTLRLCPPFSALFLYTTQELASLQRIFELSTASFRSTLAIPLPASIVNSWEEFFSSNSPLELDSLSAKFPSRYANDRISSCREI